MYTPLSEMDGMEDLQKVFPEIKDLFKENFEKGFEEYLLTRDDPDEIPIKFMCGLAYYFTQFKIAPPHAHKNLYVRLLNSLISSKKRIVFATLNYEILLEIAASHCGIKKHSLQLGNRANNLSESICILKPHGACNLIAKNDHVHIDASVPHLT